MKESIFTIFTLKALYTLGVNSDQLVLRVKFNMGSLKAFKLINCFQIFPFP